MRILVILLEKSDISEANDIVQHPPNKPESDNNKGIFLNIIPHKRAKDKKIRTKSRIKLYYKLLSITIQYGFVY